MATYKGILKDAAGNELLVKSASDNITHGDTTVSATLTAHDGDIETLETNLGLLEATVAGKGTNKVLPDIAARDALTNVPEGTMALVVDATADATVTAGAATYVYKAVAYAATDDAAYDADTTYYTEADGVYTVYSGGAEGFDAAKTAGLYEQTAAAWVKISEFESLDMVIDWSVVQNKQVDVGVVENGAGAPSNLSATGIYFEKNA